ncbi:MAG: hypothetical protein ACLRWL_05575 [Evtepia gabavorous]
MRSWAAAGLSGAAGGSGSRGDDHPETAFEMVIPVLMADIIDVGWPTDVAVILQREFRWASAPCWPAWGCCTPALPPGRLWLGANVVVI